jgi:uncharacterized protein (TIGR03000 family)
MTARVFALRVLHVAACLAAWFAAGDVQAGWHHKHGCGSCGSHHHRHGWHHRGSHGSSGGCHGGSSGGSAGGAPTAAQAPAAAPAKKSASLVPADGAVLLVEVPENARLLINGKASNLTGGVRKFAANGLTDDKQYQYEVKMIVEEDGQSREQTKTVWLVSGEEHTVSFNASEATVVADAGKPASLPAATTNLTLRVPADSKVWIEGHLTGSTGAVRNFGTRRLAQGEEWADYEVRVATIVDGQEQVVVRKLTLTGGRDTDVTIDPAAQSAAVEATASLR